MITKVEEFMNEAIKEAEKAFNVGEVPIGAVLVKDGEIISRGHNEVINGCDPTLHAEIVAIRRAAKVLGNYRLNSCELFVTVEPCIMCLGAIIHARIKKIYFGTPDPRFGAIVSLLDFGKRQIFNHHFLYEMGIVEDRCRDLIQKFFEQRRKR